MTRILFGGAKGWHNRLCSYRSRTTHIKIQIIRIPERTCGNAWVETSLPVMLTHAMDKQCSVSDVVKWMCEGPARVYGIKNKGSLIEGFDGDLTLVDLDTRRIISDSDTWTRVGWTPYAGRRLPVGNLHHRRW